MIIQKSRLVMKHMKSLKNFLNYFFLDIKLGLGKSIIKGSDFDFMSIHCIINVIKFWIVVDHIYYPDWIKKSINKSYQQQQQPQQQRPRVSTFCSNSLLPFLSIHPLLSYIVPNPTLRTLPTISLVDLSSFCQLFQLP